MSDCPKYIPVACGMCGHEDGLREDLVKDEDLRFYCDKCEEWTTCHLLTNGLNHPKPEQR